MFQPLLRRLLTPAVAAGLLAFALLPGGGGAQEKTAPAKAEHVHGTLLRRADGNTWKVVKQGDAIPAGSLLLGLPRGELLSANGAVTMVLVADIGQRGPFPVLEAGATLHANPDFDLDVTLDRGIVGFRNNKAKGAAKVRVRFRDADWRLTLLEPGTRLGVELYARHPPGLPEIKEGKFGEPRTDVLLLVTKGKVFFESGVQGVRLTAPPGPAVVHWNSDSREPEVRRLEKVPEGLAALNSTEGDIFKAVCASCGRLKEGNLGTSLDALLTSSEKADRLVGVTVAGAVDDLPRVLHALADAKHPEVRDQAILVLRHWIGRGSSQVGRLYQMLMKKGGYSDVRARNLLQLLFGFTDEQQADAETYAVLLRYLEHPSLPVRTLAHWHLVRLAPAGRGILYDAAAPEADRQRALARWRDLIPPGELPRRELPAPSKK
ncbi:MAG: hypothetical protein IT429_05220 [Gemmataceae bacterium]|nr:hypothetical protein [Gemmataceae bacterium]